METIRILITDDHPVVREGLAGILAGQADFEVVGLAADGDTAVTLHNSLTPDVTLMDLRMPGIGGIEAIRQLKSDPKVSDIPVIVISAWGDQKNQEQALEAGAIKVLTKPVGIEQLLEQINRSVSS